MAHNACVRLHSALSAADERRRISIRTVAWNRAVAAGRRLVNGKHCARKRPARGQSKGSRDVHM